MSQSRPRIGAATKCEKLVKAAKAVITTCRMVGAVSQTGLNIANLNAAVRSMVSEYRETGHVSFLNAANVALGAMGVVGGITMTMGSVKNFRSMRSEWGGKTRLNYVTSNGLHLETTPNRTTTVLGTYKSDTGAILKELGNVKSLDFGPRDGGFNLLNTPDELFISSNQFWNEYNRPWLDNVIARDDIIKIATEPTWKNITRANKHTKKLELTGFGREYAYLKKHGYTYNSVTKTMSR